MIKATICICTYNGADKLAIALSALAAVDVGLQDEFEILVVNNNSTDNTSAVVQSFKDQFGSKLREIHEPTQGLSHARNSGLAEANGEIVAYIDDDVVVDGSWLPNLISAFEEHDADLVGGKSYLLYPDGMAEPAWLTDEMQGYLSRLDYGADQIVGVSEPLYGLNYAVRKSTALKLGGFDTDLGRSGSVLLSGEEFDLQKRIESAGGTIVYQPDAVVGHQVGKERLTIRWMLRRHYWAGFTYQKIDELKRDPLPLIQYFRWVTITSLRIVSNLIKGRQQLAASKACELAVVFGRRSA